MRRIFYKKLSLPGKGILSEDFFRFVRVHGCFYVYTQIQTVFINTFLQKAIGDTNSVMEYNISVYLVQPVAMLLSVFLMHAFKSPLRTQRIGISLYMLIYIALAFFGEYAAPYYLLLGALFSVAAGFIYTTYSLMVFSYTTDDTRDAAMGVLGILNGISWLVTPLVSGVLVSMFSGFIGYQVLFVCALLCAGLSMWFSLRLRPVKNFRPEEKAHFGRTMKSLMQGKIQRLMLGVTVAMGLRMGAMQFFLNMLLYLFIQNEALVGFNSFLGGAMMILSSYLYGKIARPSNWVKVIMMTTTMLMVSTVMLFLGLNPFSVILYNVVYSVLYIFAPNIGEASYYTMMQAVPEQRELAAESFTIREFFLSAGRILGIILTMIVPADPIGYIVALLLLNASQFLTGLMIQLVQKQIRKSQEKSAS